MRKSILNQQKESTRRNFIKGLAKTCLGVEIGRSSFIGSAFSSLSLNSLASDAHYQALTKPAKSVIFIYLYGGLSHSDSLNPKPGSKPILDVINTSADDVQFTAPLSKLAKLMHKGSIIHSMHSQNGGHPRASYETMTSYNPRPDIKHPVNGSWISKLTSRNNPNLPAFVSIGGKPQFASGGWLGGKYSGALIQKPGKGLENLALFDKINQEMFDDRAKLLTQMNQSFNSRFPQNQTRSMQSIYAEAIKTMQSKDLEAFDINKEDHKLKNQYGDSDFAQGCLLAARLAQYGVKFTSVINTGWDHHYSIEKTLPAQLAELDTILSTLILDLENRGILDSTLVTVVSEMGRKPGELDIQKGRGHHPGAWSQLLFGGGVKQGYSYGTTDDKNMKAEQNPVSIGDFNATIAHALGANSQQILYTDSGRPFKIGGKNSKPVVDIFA